MRIKTNFRLSVECLIATKVCSQVSCKWNAMFESHVVTSIDRMSIIFLLKIFWAICLCKHSSTVLLTWSDQPPITQSGRSVLNFKLSVLTFSRLMSCSMSIEQKLCKVKIFHFQSMLNAIRCIDQRFTFKNSGILCLALIFNLSNPRMTFFYAKKIGCNLQVAKYHDSLPFLSSNQYEPMA